ncbi:MAG: lipid-binding SYLF domain-containing protein [Alphaproteobacteria bacterium]|jgi:lipid-binding SYLF domain-containing protein
MKTILRALFMVMLVATTPAQASSEEQQLVDQARIAVEKLRADPTLPSFPALLSQAKAVLVVPELVKAGFIFGGEGGLGVLLVRNPETGEWSPPAFYTMAAASVGLQIGVQVSKVMFLIMTDGGLSALMSDKLTLGADASIAAGPMGAGIEAGTTFNADVDIYSFAQTKGLFGGLSFEGAVLVPDDDANEAYYGKAVTARGVVILGEVENSAADDLREALASE